VKRTSILILGAALLLQAQPLLADDLGRWLQSADWHRWLDTGPVAAAPASLGPGAQEIGGRDSEFEAAPLPEQSGPSNTGEKLKAGGLSLLVPGLGQFYNGDTGKGIVMVGIEAVIWGAYIGFDQHADNLQGDARNWAGIYAGTRGDHPENYWQSVGRYMDSDTWYDAQLREARAFGEPEPGPPADDESWLWRSEDYRESYQKLRADANSAYDRRDLMILFAILNRAVSIFDAVRSGGHQDEPAVGARVLGAEVALEVSSPLPRPEARAVASWSF